MDDILTMLDIFAERDKWPWVFWGVETRRYYTMPPPEGIQLRATKVSPERLAELLEQQEGEEP